MARSTGSGRGGRTSNRDTYHHGDLAAAIVATGFDVLAERGVEGFSVAEIARRLGVSSAAPYRHFADRGRLIGAIATQAAGELAAEMTAAVAGVGPDQAKGDRGSSEPTQAQAGHPLGSRSDSRVLPQPPGDAGLEVERFAVTAGVYVRYVVRRGAGLNVIFADGVEQLHDRALAEAGRRLIGFVLELAAATGRSAADSTVLMERHFAMAHGYASLFRDRFFVRRGDTVDDVANSAVSASRQLARS